MFYGFLFTIDFFIIEIKSGIVYTSRKVIGIVFVIVMFFVVRHCSTAGIAMLETISSCCLYPLLRVQQIVVDPISRWMNRSASIEELEMTIKALQKKYDDISAEACTLKGMYQYIDETDELRTFNKRYLLQRGCVAQVLARHFSVSNQFFLVNAGSSHGIKKDMVALYCNAIVGRVVEVYPWYCKVCLITDSDCKVAALCLPPTAAFLCSFLDKQMESGKSLKDHGKIKKGLRKSASGIHEGMNDAMRTSVRYVSHLELVCEGDDVFSSGEGLVFPKGFALGKVISAEKGELFYTVVVQPALDFQALRYCTLIAKEDIN